MTPRILRCALPALLLSGCSLAPTYQRPATPAGPTWSATEPGTNAATPAAAELGWADAFADDARLQRLIQLALDHNRDLRVALLNVEQARALVRIARSDQWPQVDAGGGVVRQRIPASTSLTGASTTTTQYQATVGLTWFDLDLFGRLRNSSARALEQYFATEQGYRGAHLTLVSEIALQYYRERAFSESWAVARQTLVAAESSFSLAERQYRLGATSELDLRTAEAQVQAVRASVAEYERLQVQAANALVLLVGTSLPADLPGAPALTASLPLVHLPAGLPGELLTRRPDILQAEHELRAAHASIGVARAAFFPSISLTSSAGSVSAELSDLFASGTGSWSFAPRLTVPLFTGGRNRANLDAAEIARSAEVAQYERAIQGAFREVADGLVARTTLTEQVAALQARVNAEARRFELAQLRYQSGQDRYLTVLAAQQDLFAAQQSLINARLAEAANLVTLYRALGGGWEKQSRAPDTAGAPPARTAATTT